MNKIIAIVGMCGSGKSVVCDYYESLGFTKIYFGGVTLDKIKEEGLEINEKNEKYMREKLRKEYGMSAYAIILLPKNMVESPCINLPEVFFIPFFKLSFACLSLLIFLEANSRLDKIVIQC